MARPWFSWVQLAVDTGASASLIAWHALHLVGYHKGDAVEYTHMTTGSGVEEVPRIKVKRIEALGKKRPNLTVVGHTLPPSADVEGLLGLDFCRGRRVTIDFRKSFITVD